MIGWLKQKIKSPTDFQIGVLASFIVLPAVTGILAVYLAISSCVTPLPKAENKQRLDQIRQIECNEPYGELRVNLAKQAFYSVWLEKFKDPDQAVGMNLDRLCVQFTNKKWKVYRGFYEDGKKIPEEGVDALGQAFNRSHVLIYYSDKDVPIHKTAFVHELIHASLMALNGHGDADHQGDKYRGWTKKHSQLILEVNRFLMMLGL